MKVAMFPGSFDPLTLGHVDIVTRAARLFDHIVIAIGNNTTKTYMFPLEKRERWIRECFRDIPGIDVQSYGGLTVDFCRKQNARYLIRGLRNASDFQYEQGIAQMNRLMAPDIETVFIPCRPDLAAINSTIVREILRHGGSAALFVPESVDL